jgi:hypothetical protein
MDWKTLIVGAIILIVLIAIGAISIPTEVKVSTNQSSTTYNLEGLPWETILSPQFFGTIILIFLSAVLIFWLGTKYA